QGDVAVIGGDAGGAGRAGVRGDGADRQADAVEEVDEAARPGGGGGERAHGVGRQRRAHHAQVDVAPPQHAECRGRDRARGDLGHGGGGVQPHRGRAGGDGVVKGDGAGGGAEGDVAVAGGDAGGAGRAGVGGDGAD